MTENPISPDIPRLLSRVLLSLEGLRRSSTPTEEDWSEVADDLADFDRQQETLVHRSIRDDVREAVDAAREALEARDAEGAREALLEVGRAFDEWVRTREGPGAPT
ncbi:MAG: hypothetical protein EA352_09995 [Gemmatimonadales bacterium]|nr:MAG: hypothetical protein EA352_09995 [Gemmatimonadales bacterium]